MFFEKKKRYIMKSYNFCNQIPLYKIEDKKQIEIPQIRQIENILLKSSVS